MPVAVFFVGPTNLLTVSPDERGDAIREHVIVEVWHAEESLRDACYIAHVDASLDRLDGAKILIAEDEELCYFYLKELFRTFCPILLHASNGNEAVEICRNNPDIVLVLMDLKMPGMDGFKAVEEIKKFRPQLPVIAETAYACQTDIEKAFASGCDEYITKPVKRSILMEKIVTLLNKADAQAQLMSS